jgi:PAS domain S-box-containing protein
MSQTPRRYTKQPYPSGFDWQQIIEQIPQGLMVIDTDLSIVFANRMYAAISGLCQEETAGAKCYDIVAGPLCHTSGCPLKRMHKGDTSLEFKCDDYFGPGIQRPCKVSVRPYFEDNGHFAGIVESITDMGDLVQARNELQVTHDRLRKAMGGIIQAISLTIEKRDPYTAGHQRRVAKLCRVMAREMGFSWERIQGLRMAAAIHDLGKIHVPAAILNKPGKLSEHEMAIIRMHPQTGYDILKGIDFPWPLAEIVYQHHERLDGSGYPRGLKGAQIIQEARLLAVSDVCEAMSSFRPYRPKLGIDAAIEVLKKERGRLYDSDIVDLCLALLCVRGFNFETKYRP